MIILVCVVLVIVAVISIVRIVQLHSVKIKQEQEIQALQEEYTSGSGDTASMPDESELVKKTDGDLETEPEDDPNAWYHDIDVDFVGLKEQNEDIVGWIYFEDEESISYPLFYSGDDYYLRRNYLKEEETAGLIYIDGNNSPDLEDAHTLIYGHNMRNLSMFGKLKFYKTEEDYFENHRYFQLITENIAPITYTPAGTLTTTIISPDASCEPYDHFTGVRMNGQTLTRDKHYRAERGSLILTILPEALKDLPKGDNKLTVLFDDGEVSLTFDLAKLSKKSPNTGEF